MAIYDRQYWREFAIWGAVFLLLVVAFALAARALPESSRWRWLAALPILVVATGGFVLELRQFRRFDELQRAIYLEAMLAAGFATIAFTMGAAVLETYAGLPRVSPLLTGLVLGTAFCIGLQFAKRRYQ